MELPQDLIEEVGKLLLLIAQDGERVGSESWYTVEEEVIERRNRAVELAEEARAVLIRLDDVLLG